MSMTTTRFFERLGGDAKVPFLSRAPGTIRFDLRDGERVEHWLVVMSRNGIEVTRSAGDADCVVTCDEVVFDEFVEGRMNCMAALLRGLVNVHGRTLLLVLFQRLFAPPDEQDERVRTEAGYAGRRP